MVDGGGNIARTTYGGPDCINVTCARRAPTDPGVACGSTISSDTTLAADLNCADPGLVVVSATLDLNGHRIVGAGTGTGVTLQGTGAAVVNGSVSGFATGVRMGGQHPSVQGVTVSGSTGSGVEAFSGQPGVSAAEIEFSRIRRNGSDGVDLGAATETVIERSTITQNGRSGIDAELHVDASRYTDNRVTDNAAYGIYAFSSTSKARGNTVLRNGQAGIYFYEDSAPSFALGYVITANKAVSNGGVGISACVLDQTSGNPCAAGMIDGGGNVARKNDTGIDCINVTCARR
jgi:parallel beta-helix repeat protein